MSVWAVEDRTRSDIRNNVRVSCVTAELLLAAHDYYRARCPVLASDVGPEHTAARVLAYALANGWVSLKHEKTSVIVHYGGIEGPCVTIYDPIETYLYALTGFCNEHAQASGMAPLDVLAAIGAMP